MAYQVIRIGKGKETSVKHGLEFSAPRKWIKDRPFEVCASTVPPLLCEQISEKRSLRRNLGTAEYGSTVGGQTHFAKCLT